jgi:hypothetical protein
MIGHNAPYLEPVVKETMPHKSKKPRCQHTKTNGLKCGAPTISGREFCFFHDPVRSADRAAAQRAGGLANRRRRTQPVDDLPLETPGDMLQLVCETINAVRRYTMSAKSANAIALLVTVWLRVREPDQIERRIRRLESILESLTLNAGEEIDVRRFENEDPDEIQN